MIRKTSTKTHAVDDDAVDRPRRGRPSGTATRVSKRGHVIPLPGGDSLRPLDDIADELRVSVRTLRRKLRTVLHGGVSYARTSAIPQLLANATAPKQGGRR